VNGCADRASALGGQIGWHDRHNRYGPSPEEAHIMNAISGVNSNAAMTELIQAQSKQLAELLSAATTQNVEMAKKLVRLSAESQLQANHLAIVQGALDLYA
jgi:hypothetical protein